MLIEQAVGLKAWRATLALQIRSAMNRNEHRGYGRDIPVAVVAIFRMPRPQHPKHPVRHIVVPDLDKLCRAVLDGLTDAGVVANDAQVFLLHASKRYAEPGETIGCLVTVRAVP